MKGSTGGAKKRSAKAKPSPGYGKPGTSTGATWNRTPAQWQDLNGASRNKVKTTRRKAK